MTGNQFIGGFMLFFSVQRLHGFRQVVTHVQPQQKDELWIMQGRLHVDSLKSAGNGPIHSPVSGPIKIKHKQTKSKPTNKTHKTTTKQKPNKTTEKWDRYQLWEKRCTMTSCVSSWVRPPKMKQNEDNSSLVDSCRWWQHCVITS